MPRPKLTLFNRAETPATSETPDRAHLLATVERKARAHRTNAEECEEASKWMMQKVMTYLTSRDELRDSVDALLRAFPTDEQYGGRKLTAVPVVDYPATFHTEKLINLLSQRMAVHSSGKWPCSHIIDLYQLSQGPSFSRRVTDEVTQLLRWLSPPTLPPAA